MASVKLSNRDIGAIEAAAELVRDRRALYAALVGIIEKHEKSASRQKSLNFYRLAPIANRVLGENRWTVTSIQETNKILSRTEVTADQLEAFFQFLIRTRESPWNLSDYLPGLDVFIREKYERENEPTSIATTGVIEDI